MAQAAIAPSAGNGVSSSQNEEPATKDSLKDIFDTTCVCILCKKTPNEAVLCPHCSRMFCPGCYKTRRKCPYCFEKVTKTGLLKCRWVGELVASLQSVLSADWGVGNPRPEVKEALEKANDNLKCPVCYDTVIDAALCPHCSKIFCGRCIKVWLISRNQNCPCCVVDMTENDLVPCHWGENLGRTVDKLLGKQVRVANGNSDNFLDESLARNEEVAPNISSDDFSDSDMDDTIESIVASAFNGLARVPSPLSSSSSSSDYDGATDYGFPVVDLADMTSTDDEGDADIDIDGVSTSSSSTTNISLSADADMGDADAEADSSDLDSIHSDANDEVVLTDDPDEEENVDVDDVQIVSDEDDADDDDDNDENEEDEDMDDFDSSDDSDL